MKLREISTSLCKKYNCFVHTLGMWVETKKSVCELSPPVAYFLQFCAYVSGLSLNLFLLN